MNAEALEVLERANIPIAQARAFMRVVEIGMSEALKAVATKADLLATKAELMQMISSLRVEMQSLRVEMHAKHAELIRWVFAFILGQTAVLLGAGYFFVNYMMR